jgi:hypothetical protein
MAYVRILRISRQAAPFDKLRERYSSRAGQ